MLRRTKGEVAKELPAKHEHLIRCALSPWQRKLYTHMREQGNLTVCGGLADYLLTSYSNT